MTTEPTGSRGWQVAVDHPDGTTRRPTVLDGVEFQPRILGLPRVRIPVRRDDSWLSDSWDNADVRVWKDGRRVPVETLVDVQPEPGQTTLVCRGGEELLRRFEDELSAPEEAHSYAENVLDDETDILPHVDDPAVEPTEDLIQEVSSQDDWLNALEESIPDDKPLEVDDGSPTMLRSLQFVEAEIADTIDDYDAPEFDDSMYDGESIVLAESGDHVEHDFSYEYDVPGGEGGIGVRFQVPDDDNPEFEIFLNGESARTYSPGAAGSNQSEPEWATFSLTEIDDPGYDEGEHTLRVEVTSANDDDDGDPYEVWVDAMCIYDDRYDYDFSDNISDGEADGPQLYPESIDVVTDDVISSFGIVGARLEADYAGDVVSGNQQIAVRADDGDWQTADNTQSLDIDFDDTAATVQCRFRLSRYGSRSDVNPTTGFQSQTVDGFELFVDVDQTPLLVDEQFDRSLLEVLNEIAEFGNFIWELVWDADNEQLAIEWTRPGQRTIDEQTGVSDFSTSRTSERVYKEVVVRGSSATIRDERLPLINLGSWEELSEDHLKRGSVEVVDENDGTRYTEDEDFEVRHQAGDLKPLSSGAIDDSDDLLVSYEFKVQGAAQTADFDADVDATLVEDIPGLVSPRSCAQAAQYILEEVSEPQVSAQVTLSREPGDRSLVAARAFGEVPTAGESLAVKDVSETAEGVRLETRNRDSVGDIVGDIRQQVSGIAEQV